MTTSQFDRPLSSMVRFGESHVSEPEVYDTPTTDWQSHDFIIPGERPPTHHCETFPARYQFHVEHVDKG